MDITNITSLISTFRQETREESITPEVVGVLLQKLADLLGSVSTAAELQNLSTMVSATSSSLQNLQSLINQLNNRIGTNSGSIKTNSDEIAKMKSEINSFNSQLKTLQTAINNTFTKQTSLISANTTAINTNTEQIGFLKSDINSLLNRIRALRNDLLKYAAMTQATQMHIECIIIDHKAVVQDAYRYMRQGLTPVLFRHSVRTSRMKKNEKGERKYLPQRHGWNRFFNDEKVRFDSDGTMSFRLDLKLHPDNGKYFDTPVALFSMFKTVNDAKGEPIKVLLPFGKRSYNIYNHTHRFRFAVAFYKKSTDSKRFQFSDLRTNLAEFRVNARAFKNKESNELVLQYKFSM